MSIYWGFAGFLLSLPVALVIFVLVSISEKFVKSSKSNTNSEKDDITDELKEINENTNNLYKELYERKKIISGRKSELKKDKEKVLKVLQRVNSREQNEKWTKVGKFLTESLETINRHEIEYDLRAIEIKSIQLQHEITPYINNFDTVTFEQVEKYLETLPTMKLRSEEIVEESIKVGKPIEGSKSYKDFMIRINATTVSIEKLQDGYLTKQAILALQDVNADDSIEDMMLLDSKSVIQGDAFNIQTSITDFSYAFDELEGEYLRVRDEDEISTKLKELTSTL